MVEQVDASSIVKFEIVQNEGGRKALRIFLRGFKMEGELPDTSIGFSDKSSGGRKPKIYNLGEMSV